MHVALHYLGISVCLFYNESMHVASAVSLGICMSVSKWGYVCGDRSIWVSVCLFYNEIMHVALQCLGICMCVSQWDACSTTVAGYLYACFKMRSCMQHYSIWVFVWLFRNEIMHVALHYLGICMCVPQWDACCTTLSGYLWLFQNEIMYSTTLSGYLYYCFTIRWCM